MKVLFMLPSTNVCVGVSDGGRFREKMERKKYKEGEGQRARRSVSVINKMPNLSN